MLNDEEHSISIEYKGIPFTVTSTCVGYAVHGCLASGTGYRSCANGQSLSEDHFTKENAEVLAEIFYERAKQLSFVVGECSEDGESKTRIRELYHNGQSMIELPNFHEGLILSVLESHGFSLEKEGRFYNQYVIYKGDHVLTKKDWSAALKPIIENGSRIVLEADLVEPLKQSLAKHIPLSEIQLGFNF